MLSLTARAASARRPHSFSCFLLRTPRALQHHVSLAERVAARGCARARLRRRDVTTGRHCRHSHARLRAGSQETFNFFRFRIAIACARPDRVCCLAVPTDSRRTAILFPVAILLKSRLFAKTKAVDAIARDFLRATLYLSDWPRATTASKADCPPGLHVDSCRAQTQVRDAKRFWTVINAYSLDCT